MTDWDVAREQAAALAPVPGWVEGALSDMWVTPPFSVLNTNLAAWRDRKRYWLAMGIQSELGRGLEGVGAIPQTGSAGVMAGRIEATRQERAGREANAIIGGSPLPLDRTKASRREADQRSNLTGARPIGFENNFGVENATPGTSIFDPVLCELAYRWWAPPGGTVLDPFAGGSVRGVVAGYLGHPYTGIDLSGRQIASNEEQARVILDRPGTPQPHYIVGDSMEVLPKLTASYDLVLSCPPYYDLEVYSDDPADLSRAESYSSFLAGYRSIIRAAVALLKPNRYVVWVIGEVRDSRDKNGGYLGLVPDTIQAFRDCGLRYYNEVVLINAVGSLALRTGKQFASGRKVGKMHQNVLVFLKGDVPKGWDASREDPPDPQQALW